MNIQKHYSVSQLPKHLEAYAVYFVTGESNTEEPSGKVYVTDKFRVATLISDDELIRELKTEVQTLKATGGSGGFSSENLTVSSDGQTLNWSGTGGFSTSTLTATTNVVTNKVTLNNKTLGYNSAWVSTGNTGLTFDGKTITPYFGVNNDASGGNYYGQGAAGDGSIAIGYSASASRQNAIAIGRYASVTGGSTDPHGIAIGGGQTNNPSTTDIDKQNDAATAGRNVVAIGYNVKMGGAGHSFGMGTNIVVKGAQNFVLSAADSSTNPTKVYGQTNTVIGSNNLLDGQHYYKTLGTHEKRYGDIARNLVFGDNNTIAGTANINATASTYSGDKGAYKNVILGSSNQLMGNNYRNNLLASNATLKLGANNNTLLGSGITVNTGVNGSYVLGNNVNVTANNSVYFGDASVVTLEPTTTGDVLNGQTKVTGLTHEGLEDFSTLSSEQLNEIITAGERGQTSITIRGKKYNFAGIGQNNGGVISVGKINVVDGENVSYGRVVQNVAPGLVGAKSTDAVNGSQLYAIYKSIDDVISEKVPEDVLTLSKLDSFPVKPYENGTTIIAKQGDEYIKIDTNLKPIQDLTLKASIGNTTTYVGDPNTVVFTLTNIGNQICNSATVNINLPSNTDSYSISSKTHAHYSTGNVTVEGNSYTVTNFNPNDTLVITIKFVGNSVCGFTFSGTVTTTDVELINTNNTATVQVSTREQVNTNTEEITANTFTVPPRVRSGNDGPEFVVTEETSGKQLRVISTESIYSDDLSIDQLVQNYFHYTNVFAIEEGVTSLNLKFDTEVDYIDSFVNTGFQGNIGYSSGGSHYIFSNIRTSDQFINNTDIMLSRKLDKLNYYLDKNTFYSDYDRGYIYFNRDTTSQAFFKELDIDSQTILKDTGNPSEKISDLKDMLINYSLEKYLFNNIHSLYSQSTGLYFLNSHLSKSTNPYTKYPDHYLINGLSIRPILLNKLFLDNYSYPEGILGGSSSSSYLTVKNTTNEGKTTLNINLGNHFSLDFNFTNYNKIFNRTDFFIRVRRRNSPENYQVIHILFALKKDTNPFPDVPDKISYSNFTITSGEVTENRTVYHNVPAKDYRGVLGDYTYMNAMNFLNSDVPSDLVSGYLIGSETTYVQEFIAKPNSEFVIDITNSGTIRSSISTSLYPYVRRTIYSGIYITYLGNNQYRVVVGPNCTAEDNIVTEYIKFSVDTSTTTE